MSHQPRRPRTNWSRLPGEALLTAAEDLALQGFGRRISYSRKVFIPLTQLCRNVCGYCAFAQHPAEGKRAFLTLDEVLAIARSGAAAGCREALFTLGEKPELRYGEARAELDSLGFATTIDYLQPCRSARVCRDGAAGASESRRTHCRTARELAAGGSFNGRDARIHGQPPDGAPRRALARTGQGASNSSRDAALCGRAQHPLHHRNSGRHWRDASSERIAALLAIRELHQQYGHIQELIIQNFRAKPGTRMANHPDASSAELGWSIAAARLIFGPAMSIQAPPNLSPGALDGLMHAGINDWGGVSPITADHVNPEAPWPHLLELEQQTENAGRRLVQRLPLVPRHVREASRWLADSQRIAVLRAADADGFARPGGWYAGAGTAPPAR